MVNLVFISTTIVVEKDANLGRLGVVDFDENVKIDI